MEDDLSTDNRGTGRSLDSIACKPIMLWGIVFPDEGSIMLQVVGALFFVKLEYRPGQPKIT